VVLKKYFTFAKVTNRKATERGFYVVLPLKNEKPYNKKQKKQ